MKYVIVKILAMRPGDVGEVVWHSLAGTLREAEQQLADAVEAWPNDCFAILRLP